MKLTQAQVQAHYLNENFEYMFATQAQVDKLETWLEANDYDAGYAETTWNDLHEEAHSLMMLEFG
jgi:hypothetical protein|tara:strand:- start:278 stop:472 length:195 start_codon:yes stop_codon:yes gene_type:complete